jgi:hypothetical protein
LAVKLGPLYWVQELANWVRDDLRSEWTWLGVVGGRIVQNDGESISFIAYLSVSVCLLAAADKIQCMFKNSDTCAICATLVCLEARHRLDFERRYGFKTFPFHVTSESIADIKNLCRGCSVWTAKTGADEEEVLEVIQLVGGCDTAKVPGWKRCKLQVRSCKSHGNSRIRPMTWASIAKLIRMKGPVLGAVIMAKSYYAEGWEDRVYRGPANGEKCTGQHLVVCTGYHFERIGRRSELHIEVVDNHEADGPVRSILATAFSAFCEIHVEPLDATELRVTKPSLWRRILTTLRRIIFRC